MTDEVFELVFVCTGNRFRSPLAAAFAARATAGLSVSVSSRGILDLGPVPPLPEALELAAEYGLDLSNHAAEPVKRGSLAGIDLIIGFERVHLATAVVDGGAARDRAFTLPELVQLLERPGYNGERTGPVERARQALERAVVARGANHTLLSLPELADPLGRSAAFYRRTAAEVHALTMQLAAGLFGRRAPT